MSVPKSQRKQSSVEYITILQDIEVKLINFNESENRYIPFFTEYLGKLAPEDVKASHRSWMGQASKFHNYKIDTEAYR